MIHCRSLLQPDKTHKDLFRASQHYIDVLPSMVVMSIFEEKRFKKAKKQCLSTFLKGTCLKLEEVERTINDVRISRDGYTQILQMVQGKPKEKKLKASLMTKPSSIR